MLFEGKAITLKLLDGGVAELVFDLQGESVNKFNTATIDELDQAITKLESESGVRGLIVASAKPAFIVGADITEFIPVFAAGEQAIRDHLSKNNRNFNRIEDLPFPTVVEIGGYALGGGMEFSLACDFRLMAPKAKAGLPETKLGIFPGWGGTVRLPRLAGLDVAIEWITSGKDQKGDVALKAGVIDGVVELEDMRASSMQIISQANAGKLNYKARRQRKTSPMAINDIESMLAFGSAEAVVKKIAGRNYPAPVAAIKAMQAHSKLARDEALDLEGAQFAALAQGPVTAALVGLFLSDQVVGKKAKTIGKVATKDVQRAAVLGAGIMGGGIAYQSAYKGVPILMKDIFQEGLDLGVSEASKLLNKLVTRGRMQVEDMANTLNRISPTLSYEGFDKVDLVVEAVVENPDIKTRVLADVEKQIQEDAVLCSNTSTISISHLAEALQRPENFCGMHFFNPVHAMPLVEVIRGEKTSEETIALTVSYANALGKKAVVVNDCPGFLVNRVLFPYLSAFAQLVKDGADFQFIDKTMEKWGWPMGPAYLADVVGIDTCVHCEVVITKGYPDRLSKDFKACTDVMFESERFGQKSNKGFYNYEPDKKGKPQKLVTDESYTLLKPHVAGSREFSEEEVITRMMLPMVTELSRCLEEGVVASVEEADMALIYGLGFPPFRGGIFRWLDSIGLADFVANAEAYKSLGPLYIPTEGMVKRAQENTLYYSMG